MSDATRPYSIPVTVEWALWGKERQDLEYRLLRYSDGPLGSANFDELLTRYATGTLEALPQVTISWFEDQGQGHHIALSIHEEPEDHRVDATGRPVVLTRCFCVPYATLAEGRVSYQAMYDVFRNIPLFEQTGTIEASLPVTRPVARADLSVLRAAALLVTCKPVCVLEADRVGLTERLEFIDSVMSLLPYGLRCQLSASTWASSQFWEHKFRLFFSSARRPDEEYDVIWGGDRRSITQHEAGAYLNWLYDDAPDLVNQLAKRSEQLADRIAPVRFKGADVDDALNELFDLSAGLRRRPRALAPGPQAASRNGRKERTIEDLLIDCADRIRGHDQILIIASAIRHLGERRDDKVTVEEQDRYRQIIKEYRLLREDGPLEAPLRDQLYTALLGIAFEAPLDYEGYCQLENCAGLAPGQPMHPSLLRAVRRSGIGDLWTRLLVAGVDDDEFGALSRAEVPLDSLIGAVADLRVDAGHRHTVFETALSELVERGRSGRLDTLQLRTALAEHAYLASVVHRIYHDPRDELGTLSTVLKLAYRPPLTRSDIRTVLAGTDHAPTTELFFAVVVTSDPGEAEFAERTFIRRIAHQYDPDAEGKILQRFPSRAQREASDASSQPAPGGTGDPPSLKERITSRRRPRNMGSRVLQSLPAIQAPARRQGSDRAEPSPAVRQRVNWVRVIIFSIIFVAALVLGVSLILSGIS